MASYPKSSNEETHPAAPPGRLTFSGLLLELDESLVHCERRGFAPGEQAVAQLKQAPPVWAACAALLFHAALPDEAGQLTPGKFQGLLLHEAAVLDCSAGGEIRAAIAALRGWVVRLAAVAALLPGDEVRGLVEVASRERLAQAVDALEQALNEGRRV